MWCNLSHHLSLTLPEDFSPGSMFRIRYKVGDWHVTIFSLFFSKYVWQPAQGVFAAFTLWRFTKQVRSQMAGWQGYANGYSNIKINNNSSFKWTIKRPGSESQYRKEWEPAGMPCRIGIWVSVLSIAIGSLLLVFKLLNSSGIWLHISLQFTSAPHSLISTVCSAHVYSQRDEATGQKAAWPTEKTPASQHS